ncbi:MULTISPECIES: F0F1 ATP synthase subunit delta [unclassified Sphingomonas]|uniref:F0F1 ATP synthase subunit delta n=1 Tax=unclassified Sphingomonas TaxID=196159 RepID=UPI0006F9F15F|nr:MULTISPECIES: F0F1 ATP synthase subunit delta [unclassified Sphingomonas]KQM61824.1 ATP synthase subunit delta [Sphingomonas sp. Leaf16]KQN13259.1 ATP synthase subunit delta [Sphingomonas sp. Leaf29]KQN19984.1 ATP synthase subunit delta [Sphingomonas sp. Leaf32]
METSSGTTGGGGTIQASLGGRYATALFGLAQQQGQLTAVESSLKTVTAAMSESDDLAALVKSPLVARDDAARAIAALVPVLGLDPLTANFLGVLAQNRRLGDLPAIIRAFRDLAARSRGETNAEVVSAHPLDDAQVDALKQQLRHRVGREVAIDLKVDPTLLGGLVVKIGSQMIDSSIKTRLNTLAHAMKG